MLKIVYPICCGIDVHKDFVYACIATTENESPPTKVIVFQTLQKVSMNYYLGFWQTTARMFVWNQRESIGSPSTISLKPTAKSFWLIRSMSKRFAEKTDKKDAKWIADIFKFDLVSGSFIPTADIRQPRDLVRYHKKIQALP